MSKIDNAFNSEQNLAFLLVVSKLPNFVIYLLAGIASTSLMAWMEFIETASIIVPGLLMLFLSRSLKKNQKFRFNYGIGKVEAITAMACEIFDITGLICIALLSVNELTGKGEKDRNLVLTVILLTVSAIVDLVILLRQRKLQHLRHSRMLHTAFLSSKKEFAFDIIAISALLAELIFIGHEWVDYLSPVLCLVTAIPFFIVVILHLKDSIKDLIDLTLDEESQIKLLKVLTSFYNDYDSLGEVRSRQSGAEMFIDIELTFDPNKTYREILDTSDKMKEAVESELGNCHVNIII